MFSIARHMREWCMNPVRFVSVHKTGSLPTPAPSELHVTTKEFRFSEGGYSVALKRVFSFQHGVSFDVIFSAPVKDCRRASVRFSANICRPVSQRFRLLESGADWAVDDYPELVEQYQPRFYSFPERFRYLTSERWASLAVTKYFDTSNPVFRSVGEFIFLMGESVSADDVAGLVYGGFSEDASKLASKTVSSLQYALSVPAFVSRVGDGSVSPALGAGGVEFLAWCVSYLSPHKLMPYVGFARDGVPADVVFELVKLLTVSVREGESVEHVLNGLISDGSPGNYPAIHSFVKGGSDIRAVNTLWWLTTVSSADVSLARSFLTGEDIYLKNKSAYNRMLRLVSRIRKEVLDGVSSRALFEDDVLQAGKFVV